MTTEPQALRELAFDIERLEERQMLTGNVDVFVDDSGDIFISGDNEGNNFILGQSDATSGSQFHVRAEDGTQISYNGSTGSFHWLQGASVDSDIDVNLRGGDDYFHLTTAILGTVRGNMGRGSDDFRIQNSAVHGDVIVNSGPGASNDRVFIGGSTIDGSIKVRLGAATEDFEEGELTADILGIHQSEVQGDVTVNQSGGRASIVPNASVAGKLLFSLGAGDDNFGAFRADYSDAVIVKSGGGNDRVSFAETNLEDVQIKSGGGSDFLSLSEVTHAPDSIVKIEAGGGDDIITANGAFQGTVLISAGGGSDEIWFWSTEMFESDSHINGGGGADDQLTLDQSRQMPTTSGIETLLDEPPRD